MTDIQRRKLSDSNIPKLSSLGATDLLYVERANEAAAMLGSVITELVESVPATFPALGDAAASANIVVGEYIRTLGHSSAGDGGGGTYLVVADGTGTVDDVTTVQGNGVRLQLQHNGTIAAEQAGAVSGTEASAAIQAAWDALVTWKDADADDPDITLTHRSFCSLQNQVKLRRQDGTRVLGANIDFTGSVLDAVAGGDLSSSVHMILSRMKGIQKWGTLYGNQIAAGIDFYGMAGASSYDPQVYGCVGTHITVRGASGSFSLYRPIYNQWTPADAEYDTQANHTAIGIDSQDGDWKCYDPQGKWCGIPLRFGSGSVQVEIYGGHLFCGNNNYPSSAAFIDPVAVENNATKQNHMYDTYIDNGLIEDKTGTLNLDGLHYVDNAFAVLTHPIVRVYSTEVGQGRASEIASVGVRGDASVGFLDGSGFSWTGGVGNFSDLYPLMASRDRVVDMMAQKFNWYFPNINNVEWNLKTSGTFVYNYRAGADEISVTYDPASNEISFSSGLSLTVTTLNADNINQTPRDFADRGAFLTWQATNPTVSNGEVKFAGGIGYEYLSGATAISDMDDWLPFGDVYPDHFSANTTPGTTDMGAAILAALAYSDVVYLRGTSYATSVEIKWNNKRLQGASAHTSKIIGLSASLAVGTPIVTPGRSASVSDVWIAYDSLTGTEAQDERVGLSVGGDGSSTFVLQRAGMIERVIIDECGTAIGDFGRGVFSASFDGIEIKAHSYAAVDVRGTTRTGNLWGSIYVSGSDAYEATYGINIAGQESGGSMGQINVEHNVYSGSAVRFKGCQGLQIASLNIEGVDTSAAGKSYIEVDEALVSIGVLTVINTRMSYDNTRIVEFKEADYGDVGTYSTETKTSGLVIGTYHVAGLADPSSSLYPSYSSGRRGLNNIAGFAHFYRDSAYTDLDMFLSVDTYRYAAYNGRTDAAYYKYADTRHLSGNIRVARFDGRGEESPPRQNYVGNAAFDTWASTSLSGVTTATELADGWFIAATTGTIAGSQQADDYGLDNRYFLRFDTTGTAGNYQRLYHDITDFHELLDRRLTLSFDMKAGSAGRVLEQITCTLYTDSGTPATVYKQVLSGTSTNLDAATSWQNYRFSFDAVTSASVSAFGANPYFRLEFQINDASGTRQSQVDLRRVKLEAGPGGTDFIRRRGVA